jgi:hypothetical protein
MKTYSLYSRLRRRHRLWGVALRLALLAAPALFWALVFAGLAGVSPVERAVERLPDGAQILAAVTCPLVAVLLGCGALRGGGVKSASGARLTLGAGVVLFVFALATALGAA